ncbi:MAG TPA: hypothetical protein VM100_03455 [Longimicrobiales bacterium]|nr:hypothetical protein [Longimicrobiales bacterium]
MAVIRLAALALPYRRRLNKERELSERKDNPGPAEHELDAAKRPSKVVEQDPKDIPHKDQSQIPDVNPGKVQPGHRDREQI